MSSGKFILRLDPKIHEALKKEAVRNSLSLNELCQRQLARPRTMRLEYEAVPVITHAFPRILGILLYGSHARDEAGTGSDIDLMIVSEDKPARELYATWDRDVAPSLDARISPAFVSFKPSLTPSGVWLEVALDGLLLWQRDQRLGRYLRGVRDRIASGDFERAMVHGQPYWRKVKE